MIAPVYRFGLGRLGAGSLTPLLNPSGGQLYSGGANFPDASTVELFQDNTGAIVDQNDNSMDPITGELYQDEISGPYTVGSPVASTSAATSSTPVAWSPPGSLLQYTATWVVSTTAAILTAGIAGNTGTNVAGAIGSALPNYQMSLVKTNATSNGPATYSLNITVLDSIGHQNQSDVQGILDGLVKQNMGSEATFSGSAISVQSIGGATLAAGSASTAVPASTVGAIPTWGWIAIIGGLSIAFVMTARR